MDVIHSFWHINLLDAFTASQCIISDFFYSFGNCYLSNLLAIDEQMVSIIKRIIPSKIYLAVVLNGKDAVQVGKLGASKIRTIIKASINGLYAPTR